jgi:hypothetical protein
MVRILKSILLLSLSMCISLFHFELTIYKAIFIAIISLFITSIVFNYKDYKIIYKSLNEYYKRRKVRRFYKTISKLKNRR